MLSERDQGKPERMAYSLSDTAWVLGDVSENHVRNLMAAKVLDKVRVGRRVMVSASSIKRLVEAGGTASVEQEREAA